MTVLKVVPFSLKVVVSNCLLCNRRKQALGKFSVAKIPGRRRGVRAPVAASERESGINKRRRRVRAARSFAFAILAGGSRLVSFIVVIDGVTRAGGIHQKT